MKVMVAGSSGLIGTALVRLLLDEGHEVARLVRRTPAADDEVQWDPSAGSIETESLDGIEAVIHLGGASIAGQRWDTAYKQEIRDSRIKSTRLISEAIAQLNSKPAVFLCASALGYYADRGDEILTETSPRGEGFLAEVTAEWESATLSASEAGVRVCNMRIGVVLSETGELPRSLLTPFKFGLGREAWQRTAIHELDSHRRCCPRIRFCSSKRNRLVAPLIWQRLIQLLTVNLRRR